MTRGTRGNRNRAKEGMGGYTPRNERQDVNVPDLKALKSVRISVNRLSGNCQVEQALRIERGKQTERTRWDWKE